MSRPRTRAALADTLAAIAAVNRRHSPTDGGFERSGGLVIGRTDVAAATDSRDDAVMHAALQTAVPLAADVPVRLQRGVLHEWVGPCVAPCAAPCAGRGDDPNAEADEPARSKEPSASGGAAPWEETASRPAQIESAQIEPAQIESGQIEPGRADEGPWTPPLLVLAHLARQGMRRDALAAEAPAVAPAAASAATSAATSIGGTVCWIGRAVWPHPQVLVCDGETAPALLERSLFLDPPDDVARFWAVDCAVRSAAVAVVIFDARGMTLASSRRLQLAAARGRTLVLATRPDDAAAVRGRGEARHRRGVITASASRWRVRRVPVQVPVGETVVAAVPRWQLELVRCKGGVFDAHGMPWRGAGFASSGSASQHQDVSSGRPFTMEWNHATGGIHLPAELAHRSRSSASLSFKSVWPTLGGSDVVSRGARGEGLERAGDRSDARGTERGDAAGSRGAGPGGHRRGVSGRARRGGAFGHDDGARPGVAARYADSALPL